MSEIVTFKEDKGRRWQAIAQSAKETYAREENLRRKANKSKNDESGSSGANFKIANAAPDCSCQEGDAGCKSRGEGCQGEEGNSKEGEEAQGST